MLFSQFQEKIPDLKNKKRGAGMINFRQFHSMFLFWKGTSLNDTTSVTREIINDCTFFWLVSYSAVLISVRRATILVNRKQNLKPVFAMFAISLVLVISCEPVNVEPESRNFSALEAQRVYG